MRQIKITKQELEKLYKSMSIAQLTRHLNVPRATLYKTLKQANIPLKGKKIERRIVVK